MNFGKSTGISTKLYFKQEHVNEIGTNWKVTLPDSDPAGPQLPTSPMISQDDHAMAGVDLMPDHDVDELRLIRDTHLKEAQELKLASDRLTIQLQVTKLTLALSLKQLHEQIGKICKDADIPIEMMGP